MNCHNGADFLREAIDSIINQTYKNWELIFFDNISTDNSAQIVKNYNNKKIKIYRSEKYLICGEARNLAVMKATGEFISFLDSDDIWLKDKLEKQLSLMHENKYKVSYSNAFIKKDKLKILSKKSLPEGYIKKKIINNNPIIFSTAMIDSEIFFKENYKFNNYEIIEDLDFFFRISNKYYFGAVQDPIVIYRDHQNMISKRKFELHIKELDDWANKHKMNMEKDDLKKIKNQIYYNKCSISLRNNKTKFFFKDIGYVKDYNLVFRLLIKFIIKKINNIKN